MKFAKLTKGEQRKAIESDSGTFMLLFCSMFDDISDVKIPYYRFGARLSGSHLFS